MECAYGGLCRYLIQKSIYPTMRTIQGAQQLAADVDALASLLGAFTPRPLAHVRELDEARRLLLLTPADASALQAALAAGGQQARAALAHYGCSRLTEIQAAAVLGAMV